MKKYLDKAKTRKGKSIVKYVALNHRCSFSKKYPDKTVKEVIESGDYKYIEWCMANLGNLRFDGTVKHRIDTYKQIHHITT